MTHGSLTFRQLDKDAAPVGSSSSLEEWYESIPALSS